MNNKWYDPKFWTIIAGGAIAMVNAKYGWNIDLDKLIAMSAIIIKYLFTQGVIDIKKKETGELRYTLNSRKLVVTLFASFLIGLCDVMDIPISEEFIWTGVIAVLGYLGFTGVQDYKSVGKENGGVKHEPAQHQTGGGPAV